MNRTNASEFLNRLRATGCTVSPLFLKSITAADQNTAASSDNASPKYGKGGFNRSPYEIYLAETSIVYVYRENYQAEFSVVIKPFKFAICPFSIYTKNGDNMSGKLKQKILYDEEGRPSLVLLDYNSYSEIMELIEDVIDLKAVNELEPDELIDWEAARETL